MNGWIIYNGSLPGDKFLDQARLLQEAGNSRGVTLDIRTNDSFRYSTASPIEPLPTFVFFLDKDVLLAETLEAQGVRVFNSSEAIATCDHKGRQAIALMKANVPMPETILAPKTYAASNFLPKSFYESVLQRLGLPVIIKEAHGSFGMTVYLIETREQFFEAVHQLHGKEYLFQQYVETSHGRDVRVNVVGETIVAAMKRHSTTDFRANITNGGTASRVTLTKEQEAIARQASRAVGTDFAGVDLLYGPDGPLVCEVNAAAHIRNIYEITGTNVAHAMIDYVLKEMNK